MTHRDEVRVHIGTCDVLAELTSEHGERRLKVLRLVNAAPRRRPMSAVSRDVAMGRPAKLVEPAPRLNHAETGVSWSLVEQRGQYYLNATHPAQRQLLGSLARTLDATYSAFGVPVRFDAPTLRRVRQWDPAMTAE